MKRFGVFLALAALALGAGGVVTALAAQPITATGGTCAGSLGWTNANQTISVGDTVTWSNCTGSVPGTYGNHGLQSSSAGWCLASGQTYGTSGAAWSYPCKFTSAGTFTYVCSVHGSSMSGTITVTAAAPNPTPTQSTTTAPTRTPTAAPTRSVTSVPVAGQSQAAAAPPSATPSPSPSPSPSEEAVLPTPTASDTAIPNPPAAATSGSSSGGSAPWLAIGGFVVVAGGAAGGFYLWRRRQAG